MCRSIDFTRGECCRPVTKPLESAVSSSAGFVGDSVSIFLKTSGFTYILLAAEMNANVSSLVIDKTKEKIVDYKSQVSNKLTKGSFFFVIPPKISNGETFVYDEEMGRMIRNYLTLLSTVSPPYLILPTLNI